MNEETRRTPPPNALRRWAPLLLCLCPAALTAQAIADLGIETPRDFGYAIGDRIRHEMRLTLNRPYRLERGSLPAAGRLNRWLEISAAAMTVEHRDRQARYRVIVDYQIFNAPSELTSVTVPQLEVTVTGGSHPIPVFFPEWAFTVARLTEPGRIATPELRPDHRPEPLPVGGRRARLAVSTSLLAALLVWPAFNRWRRSRRGRGAYPFSRALRELRRLPGRTSAAESYRLGLKAFHAAVNATAGRVVLRDELDGFLETNPRFAAVGSELAQLFEHSGDVFFNELPVPDPRASLQQLVALCRRCRALERSGW